MIYGRFRQRLAAHTFIPTKKCQRPQHSPIGNPIRIRIIYRRFHRQTRYATDNSSVAVTVLKSLCAITVATEITPQHSKERQILSNQPPYRNPLVAYLPILNPTPQRPKIQNQHQSRQSHRHWLAHQRAGKTNQNNIPISRSFLHITKIKMQRQQNKNVLNTFLRSLTQTTEFLCNGC